MQPRHVLPDFVIIGAQKGGTTSLYNYLLQSPQVLPASRKEVHYFSQRRHLPVEWYRQQFPTADEIARRSDRLGRTVLTGESTPYYLFHPLVPPRMASVLPQVKLIALLREPVSRAFSHYRMVAGRGHEPLPFGEALAREPERMAGEVERMAAEPTYNSIAHQRHTYASRGTYVDQLLAYADCFPRENLLVLDSGDLFACAQAACDTVADFLEIGRWRLTDAAPSNVGSAAELDHRTERALQEFFHPWNQRLYKWLGVNLGWPRPADSF